MESLTYLLLQVLFFSSLIPLFFLILKFLVFGIKKIKKNLAYNLFILIIPFVLFSLLMYIKNNTRNNIIKINTEEKIINNEREKEITLPLPVFDDLNSNYNFSKEIIIENNLNIENIDLKKCIEKKVEKNESITSILKPFN